MQINIPLRRIRSINWNISLGTMIAALLALLLLLVSLLLLNQFRNQQQQSERNEVLLTGWQQQLLTATPAAVARQQLQERLMIEQQRFASASELLPGPEADLAILQRINEAAERSGVLLTTLQEVGEFQEGALIGWQYKLAATSSLSRLTDFTARLEQEAFPVAYFADDMILTIQEDGEYLLAGTLVIYGSTFSTAQLALPPTIAPEQMGQELQKRAKHALALQDYELALSLLLQLAALEPENSDASGLLYETHVQYGLYLLEENHPSLAKEQCEAARTIDPTDQRALNCLLALEEVATPSSEAIVVIETETTATSSTPGTPVSGTPVSGTPVSGTPVSATPTSGTQASSTATSDSGTAPASPTATQSSPTQGYPSPSPTRTNTPPPTATQRASATTLPPTVPPPPTRTPPPPTNTPNRVAPSNTPIPSDTPLPSNTPTTQASNTRSASNTPPASATSTATQRATSTATNTSASNTPTVTNTPTTDTPTVTNTPTTDTPTVTGTPPTDTPTVTGTPPTNTPTDTPTVTGTPPTSTPTVTGTPPTATPTVAGTSVADNSVPADSYGALSPFYLPNCGLTQIKGSIRDNDSNAPINGVTVRVWYDGAADNEIYSLPTGQDPGKAAGEWDVVLAPYPKEGQWYVQVVNRETGAGLSPVQTVYTDIGACKPDEGGHQVVIIDFIKYSDDGPGEPVASSTITRTPSITPTPSITLTPSKTLTPSNTPVLSATPTQTPTITPTPTRTTIPMVYARVHDPDLQIPDGPATDGEPRAVSTINVPDDIIISRIRVYPDIEHDDVGDLEINLIHPDGTGIRLHSRDEDAGQEAIQRWFELTGGDIALIAGKSALGDWQLEIIDRYETNLGALRNWQLEIYSP